MTAYTTRAAMNGARALKHTVTRRRVARTMRRPNQLKVKPLAWIKPHLRDQVVHRGRHLLVMVQLNIDRTTTQETHRAIRLQDQRLEPGHLSSGPGHFRRSHTYPRGTTKAPHWTGLRRADSRHCSPRTIGMLAEHTIDCHVRTVGSPTSGTNGATTIRPISGRDCAAATSMSLLTSVL